MKSSYDVVIIGGGSGGYVAAIRSAQLGLNVALVEKDKVGGTCLHRGCIPTKALLQSAAVLDSARGAEQFGIKIKGLGFDYKAVTARKNAVVGKLHQGVEFLLNKNRVERFSGVGKVLAPGMVTINEGTEQEQTFYAKATILAAGSRPRLISEIKFDGRGILTSDEALNLDHVPKSAIILGGGAVGVEFASLWSSLGAKVTVVEMENRLVPLEDIQIGNELQKQFGARGINCMTNTKLLVDLVKVSGSNVSVVVDQNDKTQQLQAEVLLIAIGRTPNLEGLGLENTTVKTEKGYLKVNEYQQTAQTALYAIGDMVGGFALAHKAMHEGIVAAETIAGHPTHPVRSNLITRTTYCHPQIGSFGLSEAEAKERGYNVKVGTMPFTGNARALVWGQTGGFCKVVSDADNNDILGVHIIGNEVTELIAGPALGALLEATPYEISRAVAPHPTLSEVLGEAALAVSGEAIHI